MSEAHHHHPDPHGGSLNRVAAMATLHCLSGCAIGEVAGMAAGALFGLGNWTTVVLSTGLAFATGYAMTLRPLVKPMGWRHALAIAFAADTASIAAMELADNATMLLIPGAMNATLAQPLFWVALAVSLALGGLAAFPVNRFLIARGKGHAVAHAHHHH